MSKHEEFPPMTPETKAVIDAFYKAGPGLSDRKAFAAFLREAMKQAGSDTFSTLRWWDNLAAIANNLHSPPPPAPTFAQAREAARQLGGANAEVVHAFLATLKEGEP